MGEIGFILFPNMYRLRRRCRSILRTCTPETVHPQSVCRTGTHQKQEWQATTRSTANEWLKAGRKDFHVAPVLSIFTSTV